MRQSFRFCLIGILLIVFVGAVAAQKPLKIDYTVGLSDPGGQQFHVTTDIKDIAQPKLSLSLPTWAPGWYTVENYYKNVLRFRITDAKGNILPHIMTRKQTWEVDTKGLKEVKIDYDYRATVLALNQAKIRPDFAFFQGIELFLQAEGHRNEPSTVHFAVPQGWKIVTALKDTSDPSVFTADNYDALVDAPTEMGNFDLTKFEVEGKPHYFVASPAGVFSKEKTDRYVEMLKKIATTDSAIFGGLPYEKYCYFYFFQGAESNASGALEHLNAFVAFAPAGERSTPEMLISTGAHEYFHLWNVKRIRPAEMWPYDYSRENETPLLWVSEGFTNYYSAVARYRSGLMTADSFLQYAASAASQIENSDVRNYVSPAEASVSTWAGYDTPVAFGISYYTQGQNLAALLDLSIRNDTDGASGLDDVMRALFNERYKKGLGYTTEDMIGIVNRITKKDYHDFYSRYVFGTEVPDYSRIFGYAGYAVDKKTETQADTGFFGRFRSGGLTVNGVAPGSGAAAAGLRNGDVITKINGQSPANASLEQFAGQTVTFTVTRGGNESEVPVKIGTRQVTSFKFADAGNLSERQKKVRDSWLKQ